MVLEIHPSFDTATPKLVVQGLMATVLVVGWWRNLDEKR